LKISIILALEDYWSRSAAASEGWGGYAHRQGFGIVIVQRKGNGDMEPETQMILLKYCWDTANIRACNVS